MVTIVSWPAVSTTLLPLVGVVLGASGTLVGQYLTTRVAVQRDKREQEATDRAERKEAIMGFLSAAQMVELLLDRKFIDETPSKTEAWERLHALWLAHKLAELVCSSEVAQVSYDYAFALHCLVRETVDEEDPPSKRECRYAFMAAARRELGVTDAALRRWRIPEQETQPTRES
jgi:hypothetical protein